MKGLSNLLSVKWPLARPMITIVDESVQLWVTGIYNKNHQKRDNVKCPLRPHQTEFVRFYTPQKPLCRQLHTMVYQFKILDECEHLILIPTKLYNRTSVSSCRVFFFFFFKLPDFFSPSTIKANNIRFFFFKVYMYKIWIHTVFKKNYTIKSYRYPMILYNWRAGHGKKLTLKGVMIHVYTSLHFSFWIISVFFHTKSYLC